MHIYSFNDLKFTVKHLKNDPIYFDLTINLREHTLLLAKFTFQKHSVIYIVTLSWCCGSMPCVLSESYTVQNGPGYGCALCDVQREVSLVFLNHNFSKEQCMLPEDDRMIETCRSVLSVLMRILNH
jgi:hypothetical protein